MACEFTTKQGVIYKLDADTAHLARYSWTKNSVGYLRRTVRSKTAKGGYRTLFMHRLIMNATDAKLVVDHINGDKYDNRRVNLRICTQSENLRGHQKPAKSKTSKYRGVHYASDPTQKLKPWKMQYLDRMGQHHYKSYATESEAAVAYNLVLELYGTTNDIRNDVAKDGGMNVIQS